MPKIKTERLLLMVFILIFCVALLPSLVKRLLPAPKVIETMPAMSATNVPIDTQQIKFVFNRPMAEKKHIVYQGMRIKAQPKWIDERQTILVLTLTEPLRPGAFYGIVLNSSLNSTSEADNLMKGRWGKPLGEYVLTFMTAPSDTMQNRIAAFNLGSLHDTDKDGLDDRLEIELGTLPSMPDSDKDGLTDYEEYCKYGTDPTSADSDGDGTPDADWHEKREYTYSIRAVLELKPPWNLEAMNDLFQDARLMERAVGNRTYTKVEVIVYPYASPVLLPTLYPYKLPSEAFRKYTQPTTDLNYSSEMQAEIQGILSGVTHTFDVLAKLQHEISEMKLTLPLYPPFAYTYKRQEELVTDRSFFESIDREVSEEEIEEALAVNYFGDSMFRRKRYGACISRSRLFASMLRAAGIPARVTMAVPMIYYYKGTGEWKYLIKNLSNEGVAGGFAYDKPSTPNQAKIVGHSQVEAYLNNHWIRLGYQLNEGSLFAGTDQAFIKIIDAADFTEVDFTKTWSPAQWVKERPYRTVELSDQAAKYESKPQRKLR
ncbi:MAG: Ig-like domain-containing protein [Candidatus Poribacteria bacterium]|nr:Ig-like domain-containing protein [Candidatus Poribacteria bacterium]